MRRVTDLVQQRSLSERRSITGLNEDRADTIVAGALVVDALMTELRAPALLVSGQGLREGMALQAMPRDLPSLRALRAGALRGAVERFIPDRASLAEARLALVQSLTAALGFDAPQESIDAIEAAAFVQDVGRSVDYYNCERHTEFLLLEHGLSGWSHREVALICALIRQAHQEKYAPALYRPLINGCDHEWIGGAGTLLALAEEIANRRPAGGGGILSWRREEERLVIVDETLAEWVPDALIARVRRSFGLELSFTALTGAEAR
jgi:exopolyphosphatase/guanosine-5'-triphosphate,3'-diphosphate pyrophosphatase